MKMLLDLGADATPDKIESTVRGKLARKEKIPGFGHRVYHTMDPRAVHLRQMSRDLGKRIGQPQWFEMSERIETLVKAEKNLNPNVDFYSASTYHALGIPIALFTPIFAVSRCAGWTAHVLEQLSNNRLIRPRARVHGPHCAAALGADGGQIGCPPGLKSRLHTEHRLHTNHPAPHGPAPHGLEPTQTSRLRAKRPPRRRRRRLS